MSAVRVGGTGATSQSGSTYTFDGVAIDLSDGTTAVTKLVEIEGENLPTGTDITLDSTSQATATIRALTYGDPSTMKGANVTITPNANVTACDITLKLGDLATIVINCVVTQPAASVTGVSINFLNAQQDGAGWVQAQETMSYSAWSSNVEKNIPVKITGVNLSNLQFDNGTSRILRGDILVSSQNDVVIRNLSVNPTECIFDMYSFTPTSTGALQANDIWESWVLCVNPATQARIPIMLKISFV